MLRQSEVARGKLSTEAMRYLPSEIYSPCLNQWALTQKLRYAGAFLERYSAIDTVSPQHMLTSDRDGWFPIASGFSTLVPKVVRGWAPVLAILDSTKLLHLGSTVQDDLLVAEGRKRFLLTTSCLRSNLKHDPGMALPGLMIVSLGVSLCEVSVLQLPPRDRRMCRSRHRHAVLRRLTSQRYTARYPAKPQRSLGKNKSSACPHFC